MTMLMVAFHSLEIFYVFGLPQLSALNVSIPAFAPLISLATSFNFTAADVTLAKTMADHWWVECTTFADGRINFAYYTDPNGQDGAAGNGTYWPKYGSELTMLNLDQGNVSLIADTYRAEQMEYFLQRPDDFNYKRAL